MKRTLRIFVLLGLLLALVPMPPVVVTAQVYPGPYDLVVLEDDPELIMEALAYIAAIHRLNAAPLPPILIYDGTNEDELQGFYEDYGPFDEMPPVVLTVGTVPAAALPATSVGGWVWTSWRNHPWAGGVSIDRNDGPDWNRPYLTQYLNNAFTTSCPGAGVATDWLRATLFGFRYSWILPVDALIGGAEARIARDCTAGTQGIDDAVYLVVGGVEQGSNHAGPDWWPLAVNFEYETYVWDREALCGVDVRDDTFGVQLSATTANGYGILRVDHICMRVLYSLPPVALTITDIRVWWAAQEPTSFSLACQCDCNDGQAAAFQALGAAETAIANYYTDTPVRPYFATHQDTIDWEQYQGGGGAVTHYYYYGRCQYAAEQCAAFFGLAPDDIIYRNERGGDKTLPPEEGVAPNMKEWLQDNVWPVYPGDPTMTILTSQQDNSTSPRHYFGGGEYYDRKTYYLAPIYSLFRKACIYPVAAVVTGDLGNCPGYNCVADIRDEIRAWIDDGSGGASWVDAVVYWAFCGQPYGSHTGYIPAKIGYNSSSYYVGTRAYFLDLDDDRYGDVMMGIMYSAQRARTVLAMNRGVFARAMKNPRHRIVHATAEPSAAGSGQRCSLVTMQAYTDDYVWYHHDQPGVEDYGISMNDYMNQAEEAVVIVQHGHHNTTRSSYPPGSMPHYASIIGGRNLGPAVWVADGCASVNGACLAYDEWSGVNALWRNGLTLIVGTEVSGVGSLYGMSECFFAAGGCRIGEATMGWLSHYQTAVYGDPLITLDDLTYWCDTHNCDD